MTTALPTTHLTPTAVSALAARHARASEDAGRLHPEVIAALPATGFARHFVPRLRGGRAGGRAGGFTELVNAVAAVGEACASTAWICALQAGHARLAAHLPEPAQAELWADGPDTAIAAAVVPPSGRLVQVPGGRRLTGRWAWASGADHADWILLATLDDSGAGQPLYRVLALPREDVQVHATWDSVGLRGTGSDTVTVDDVFVPEHRSFLREALMTGVRDADAAPCHRVPYTLVASLLFCAPALGAARGALDAWTALARQRDASGDPGVQQTLARCSAEIDAAQLLLETAAARADRAALTPPAAFEPATAARNQRDAAVAVDMLVGAVERLFRTAGVRALSQDSPLQRAWRDVHAVAAHATLQPGASAAAYATGVFADAGD
ncbi:acyl-CoA dehydrogenase family protein [Streptomyces sp. ME02-8801-2C]|uniref:acyl-CoA dehydrogenase family protein n=1 Tax=Streptomyces sp. ME02-8801-2C TaxID=3028680 RepID=UPI0029BE22EE|nr:acyl-CoA dehydrogenase family protein [Streptomyces sp. ME02-8801-2C]MDX3455654.1 acyl-CoA dehydrogenase family protein [Streptomyces sp. ME02-8801-2C]